MVYDQKNQTLQIGFHNTYDASDSDSKIIPGDTAEYIIRATISGTSGSGEVLQVTIENMPSNLPYYHRTFSAAEKTSEVYPLLPGLTSVRGGILSN